MKNLTCSIKPEKQYFVACGMFNNDMGAACGGASVPRR
jgi:hypothetical protein